MVGTGMAIALGLSALFGAKGAHDQASAASTATGLQKALMDKQSSLANMMTSLGKDQISTSKPALDAAMKYYMTMAQGNKSQINTALAPERASVAETAKGAERGLEAHMGAGAQRDQALADLTRKKEGTLGLMPMQARSDAMGKLATLGESGIGRGESLMSGASGALNGQTQGIGQMFGYQQAGNNAWNQFGSDLFKTYGPWLMGMKGGSGFRSPGPGPWASGYQF